MKNLYSLLIIVTLIGSGAFAGPNPVRIVRIDENQVANIKTAIGFTTILQLDFKPSSIVVGDQDAFKVESNGKTVLIKPLLNTAQSNLFIFSQYDRMSFKLITTTREEADFNLKIKMTSSNDEKKVIKQPVALKMVSPHKKKQTTIEFEAKNTEALCLGSLLKLRQVEQNQDFYEFQFLIQNLSSEDSIPLDVRGFGIRQNGITLLIDRLLTSGLKVEVEKSGSAQIFLKKSKLSCNQKLEIYFSPLPYQAVSKECQALQLTLKCKSN